MGKKTTNIELISAYEFAERKGVQAQAVYYRIKVTKEIETVKIGKRIAIDWEKFSHVEFPNAVRFIKDEDELSEIETPHENTTEEIPTG